MDQQQYRVEAQSERELARMLAFARRHDWGYDAEISPTTACALRVGCDVIRRDGSRFREFSTVRSMRQLRSWAGY